MSSSLPLALAALLLASGAARAADTAVPKGQAEFVARALIDPGQQTSAHPSDLTDTGHTFAEPALGADFGGSDQFGRRSTTPLLKVRLGRVSAFGRSPGAAPPAYGEVGINVAPLPGLSLVPSYKVVLDDASAGRSSAVSGQVLKLGARIPF